MCTTPQTCYPPEWFAPLVFDSPWSTTGHDWYASAPNPALYPRLASSVMALNSKNCQGKTLAVTYPGSQPLNNGTCSKQNSFTAPTCSDTSPCPPFALCDFRYGQSGICGAPQSTTQLS